MLSPGPPTASILSRFCVPAFIAGSWSSTFPSGSLLHLLDKLRNPKLLSPCCTAPSITANSQASCSFVPTQANPMPLFLFMRRRLRHGVLMGDARGGRRLSVVAVNPEPRRPGTRSAGTGARRHYHAWQAVAHVRTRLDSSWLRSPAAPDVSGRAGSDGLTQGVDRHDTSRSFPRWPPRSLTTRNHAGRCELDFLCKATSSHGWSARRSGGTALYGVASGLGEGGGVS
jgi:hypothetical protein